MRSGARPSSAPEAFAFFASAESAPATNSYWSSMRAARRCTAPMKAPCPPPTMPSLMRPVFASLRPETMALPPYLMPRMRLIFALSAEPATKSSKLFSVVLMMWLAMKGAPSMAPCTESLMQHSHSSTAQLS